MRVSPYKAFVAAIVATFLFIVLALTMPAGAHSDGGIDEPWVDAMNQESFWEDRFDAECTKYEPHNGFIPASYEIAISKGESDFVRVYDPAPDDAFIVGPGFEDGQGRHKHRAISWVMKCDVTPDSTTTTTIPEETTTTTSPPTTVPPTTQPPVTSPPTTPPNSLPPVVTTPPSVTTPPELPFTGSDNAPALIVAALALLAGIGMVHTARGRA